MIEKNYTLIAHKEHYVLDHDEPYCDIENEILLIESGLTKEQLISKTLELASELSDWKPSWENIHWFEDSNFDLIDEKNEILSKASEIKRQKELERKKKYEDEIKKRQFAEEEKEKEQALKLIRKYPELADQISKILK